MMKHWIFGILVGLFAMTIEPALAASSAVKIDVASDGSAIDSAAITAIRQTVGSAIGNGTVDSFYVLSPRVGGPIPREGGISACAEQGFTAAPARFNRFVARLRAIRANPGTFITIEPAASCTAPAEPPQACGGIAGLPCSPGQICVDDPTDSCDPAKGGADCIGICKTDAVVCTQDVMSCPDGSFVSRIPPSCAFAPCPVK